MIPNMRSHISLSLTLIFILSHIAYGDDWFKEYMKCISYFNFESVYDCAPDALLSYYNVEVYPEHIKDYMEQKLYPALKFLDTTVTDKKKFCKNPHEAYTLDKQWHYDEFVQLYKLHFDPGLIYEEDKCLDHLNEFPDCPAESTELMEYTFKKTSVYKLKTEKKYIGILFLKYLSLCLDFKIDRKVDIGQENSILKHPKQYCEDYAKEKPIGIKIK